MLCTKPQIKPSNHVQDHQMYIRRFENVHSTVHSKRDFLATRTLLVRRIKKIVAFEICEKTLTKRYFIKTEDGKVSLIEGETNKGLSL